MELIWKDGPTAPTLVVQQSKTHLLRLKVFFFKSNSFTSLPTPPLIKKEGPKALISFSFSIY